jgi:hypothetical protein
MGRRSQFRDSIRRGIFIRKDGDVIDGSLNPHPAGCRCHMCTVPDYCPHGMPYQIVGGTNLGLMQPCKKCEEAA